ncbi:Zn(II)2Cys6 transcription factor [Aspergillus homomorphus CBS 101889]|uniref:Zn(2)-C6 fungal-type domain-containing protein n=1 Tax=Aspergillus homomorphus (strain CBS 101889) TaxID=1450537 RepID=A0A395HXM0_ASPHC|nr:hypothetical protein BO97DRAFT_451300 [Aspergillus homomorphus CBS 101889]RAL12671.1 hypothetical protein BO97DRAFT_451300 [Aspergillus homomorphus CBS 101889]
MGGSKTTGNRTRRTHALGACKTCRRRHAKCDQRRPKCQMCRASGVACEGFADDIRWVAARKQASPSRTSRDGKPRDVDRDRDRQGPRRVLYTEQSRLSMSDSLSAELVSGSIDASLAEIDVRARDSDRAAEGSIVVGPFAVLDLSSTSHGDAVAEVDEAGEKEVVSPSRMSGPLVESSSGVSPSLSQESIAYMNDLLQWSDLFSLDLQMPDSLMSTAFDIGDALVLEPGAQAAMNGGAMGMTDPVLDADGELNEMHPTAIPQIPSNPHIESVNVLADAHFLLRHFQDHVISRMSAIPLEQKSPWKILNLPSAVVTFSDLTFLGSQNISHARLANLYCLLACSALHLSVNPTTNTSETREHWQPIAEHAYNLAKNHMQTSLRHETQPKAAKYKDQLMAICALTEFAIISGQQQDARCYMVDAERLLRLRGLSKRRISQKARLLHHVYTWLRIVGESTYTLHDYTPSEHFMDALKCSFRCQNTTVHSTTTTGHSTRLDDFLRLARCPSDSDLNIHEPKSQDVGLHDIHLQDSRSYPDTLYHQIYGIPEAWLSLVSQTTRLANVMETFRVARRTPQVRKASIEAWDALHRRSARLENMVCALTSRKVESTASPRGSEVCAKAHEYLLQALNAALVIFFYRRIRDVHPLILEGHVDKVVSSLSRFDAALTGAGQTGPGTAWPLFIAGCEATTLERRWEILKLLEKGEARCGFAGFGMARDVMKEVWKQQDEHITSSCGESVPTWLDVTKRRQIWPILA